MLIQAGPLQIDELLSFYTYSQFTEISNMIPLTLYNSQQQEEQVKSPHTFCRIRACTELTRQAVKLPLVDQSKVITILPLMHDLFPDKQMGLDSKKNGKVENLSSELTSEQVIY